MYYAQINQNSSSIHQVIGWFDTDFGAYTEDFSTPSFISLTKSEWQNRHQTPNYDPSSKSLTNKAVPVPLSDIKSSQKMTIKSECASAIAGGFQDTLSDGSTHTFTLSTNDQLNGNSGGIATQHAILSAKPWKANTVYNKHDLMVDSGEYYIAVKSGTTGASKPTWPTSFGTSVVDGGSTGVTWALFGLLTGTTKGNIRLKCSDILNVFRKGVIWKDACISQYDSLIVKINNAATESDVKSITWTNPTL